LVEKLATNLEIDPDPDPGSEPVSEEHGILPLAALMDKERFNRPAS